MDKGLAGWRPTGQYDGLGVFVWSTNSQQDQVIENNGVGLSSPTFDVAGNGSAAIP